jgi:hypothetical protein
MRKPYLVALSLLLSAAGASYADTVFPISVNTNNLSGTTGSIDFQFNFGTGESQAANVTISNLTGGTNGAASPTGDVSGGPFPTPVTISNGFPSSGFNDYFETYTFGKTLSFSLDFSGPAVTAPDGFSTGNSVFSFLMFSDTDGTIPAPGTDVNGVAGTVTVNPDGSLTTTSVSPNLIFVPEPSSLLLMLAPALMMGVAAFRRRRTV